MYFTGKGGVGKTSMACAAAVQLADRGLRVLLVSTDPASNLDEVLGTELSNDPTAIKSVPNLFAMNIDPEEAAREYRERMVGLYRGVLTDTAVASMEEQFSGSCTLEIAAFDEFSKLLGDKTATNREKSVALKGTVSRMNKYLKHNAVSIRPFIGARDFGLSRRFYAELGFAEVEIDTKLSLFKTEGLGFYLQDAYVQDWIDNTMIFMEVDDTDRFWANLLLLDLPSKYPGVRLAPVRTMPWGKECFVHDPSGILWHFGEFKKKHQSPSFSATPPIP